MGDGATTSRRRRLGAWYTPDDVVDGLLALTLDPLLAERRAAGPEAVAALRVLDPSCGDGAFLVAAGERIRRALVALGVPEDDARRIAFGACVVGVDVDPDAVDACRRRFVAAGAEDPDDRIVAADALLAADEDWSALLGRWGATDGVDAVVGNPPFLNPLADDTSASPARRTALRARFGDAARGHVNPASLFLLLADRLAARRGSVVTLVQPLSLLAAHGARTTRSTVLAHRSLSTLWVADERVFDAAVDVCAPVLTAGPAEVRTRLAVGRDVRVVGSAPAPSPADDSWSGLLATIRGVPDVPLRTDGVLGDLCEATADFRDQYYGLAGHVVDAEHGDGTTPRLLTAGLVDPAHERWGTTTTRLHKATWTHPRIDLGGLPDDLRRWAGRRLVPKVVVASQTRVLEAIVDADGSCLPSVPLVTLTPHDSGADAASLWLIAAALTSPPVTMEAARRHQGAALSSDALKLGARDVAALPLPADHGPWIEAAEAFRAASTADEPETRRPQLLACGRSMCAAYGVGDDEALLAWWADRLPSRPD